MLAKFLKETADVTCDINDDWSIIFKQSFFLNKLLLISDSFSSSVDNRGRKGEITFRVLLG